MYNVLSGFFLVMSVLGEAGIATDVVNTGSSLANLSAAGILGVVALASVLALVKVYSQKQADTKETILLLTNTISKNTECLTALKDAVATCTKR